MQGRKFGNRVSRLFELFVAFLLMLGLAGGAAMAQPGPIQLRAQPLAQSLNDVARLTGTNILFAPDAVRGVIAPPVDGAANAQDAVRHLIRGTDLEMVIDPGGASAGTMKANDSLRSGDEGVIVRVAESRG